MKLVWGAAIVMLVLVVSGVLIQYMLACGADHMVQLLHGVGNAVLAGHFDEAELLLSQVEDEWIHANTFWCMVVDHDEMDSVRESLARLKQHIHFRDPHLCMVEVDVAKQLIGHIPKKEAFSLESVL